MLGISLPLAATALLLVVDPIETDTREVILRCGTYPVSALFVRYNPVTHVTYYGYYESHYSYRSHATSTDFARYIDVPTDGTGWRMRIDWKTLTYDTTHEQEKDHDRIIGTCKVLP